MKKSNDNNLGKLNSIRHLRFLFYLNKNIALYCGLGDLYLLLVHGCHKMFMKCNLDTPFFVGFQTLEKLWAIAALITAGG